MSELVVFKANELAVSRYDLTEHETKLILFCIAKLNPTIETPNEEQRTVKFSCAEYAKIMEISYENAWGRLNTATSDLFKRSIELIYPSGDIAKRIFNWAEYAEFNRDKQEVILIFSKYIIPLLFHLKKFIKYNLKHVKAFENKYSMRIYEWMLKELSQRKTYKANIAISIVEFKFMLMLEANYPLYAELNRWILKPIMKDLNTHSNMKLMIEKRGRPADTLIFQVEIDQQMDLVKELCDEELYPHLKLKGKAKSVQLDDFHVELQKILRLAQELNIHLSKFEKQFLHDMNIKYHLNGSFAWLTQKQKETLAKILTKYR